MNNHNLRNTWPIGFSTREKITINNGHIALMEANRSKIGLYKNAPGLQSILQQSDAEASRIFGNIGQ